MCALPLAEHCASFARKGPPVKLLLALVISLCLCFTVSGCDGSSSAPPEPKEEEAAEIEQGLMPYSSVDYCTMDWTLESLEDHFRELGFDDFEENPVEPDDDSYNKNIFEIYVKSGWFTDPWEAGDQLDTDDTIVIYYNEAPPLTVDTCPELAEMIQCADSYLSFAEEYDDRFVSFDAYVSYQLDTFDLDTIIMVSGDNFEENQLHDWTIYIGDRTYGNEVNGSLPVGTRVHVEGQISLRWSEYYDQLYVEGLKLYEI